MTIPKRDICSTDWADQGFTEKVGEKLRQPVGDGLIRVAHLDDEDVRPDLRQPEDKLACPPV